MPNQISDVSVGTRITNRRWLEKNASFRFLYYSNYRKNNEKIGENQFCSEMTILAFSQKRISLKDE